MKRIILISVTIFLSVKIIFCATLHVPQDYISIQAAIDAAKNADTVLVSEGTYYENIDFRGKGIVLASNYIFTKDWQTVRNTIIDGSKSARKDSASSVRLLSKEDSTAVLEGFTITGGSGTGYIFTFGTYQEGAGIILDHSSAIIRNNIIENNVTVAAPGAQNGGGGGISSMYGSPTIYNNIIMNNNAGYAGGIVLNWSGGKVRNNIIYHNCGGAAYGTGGIMIWKPPANSAFVENNTIVGNYSYKDAGGISISVEGLGTPVVRNNIVWGNRQVIGAQITEQYRQDLGYNDVEDYNSGTNISQYPQFEDSSLALEPISPCVDAGDSSAACNDPENPSAPGNALAPSQGTLRNDIGAYGGFLAKPFPSVVVRDFYLSRTSASFKCNEDSSGTCKVEIMNRGSVRFVIDSIVVGNKSVFNIGNNLTGRILDPFEKDSIEIRYSPSDTGTFRDTVKIFHNALPISNPSYITLKLVAVAPTGIKEQGSLPKEFKLYQNCPNPFNPSTMINYQLPMNVNVTLKIYDILGKEVKTLVENERQTAGSHSVTFDAGVLSSGVYFYSLRTGKFNATKKLMLLK